MSAFSLPFMQIALAASLMAGLALALVGAFVLVRRVSFSGLAVSQLAALGTVAGGLLGLHYGEFGLALALVGGGMLLIAKGSKLAQAPSEAWVAALYIFGAALSVLLLSKDPHGESHTLSVFFGNVLSLGALEVWEAAAVLAVTTLFFCLRFHQWLWLSFDPLSARVSSPRAVRWDFLFYALFTLTMTVSIHIFGVLLAFAYLLLPATAGLLLARGVCGLFVFIPALTIGATVFGFYGSFRLDFPSGPFIAATLAALAAVAGIFRYWKSRA